MCACHYCGRQEHLQINCHTFSNSEILTKSKSTLLPTNDTTANISNSSLSTTSHLSITTTNNVSAAATNNISTNHSTNTTTKSHSDDIRKLQIKSHPKLEIGDGCPPTNSQLINPTIRNLNSQNYLSLLVIPEDATSNNLESNQSPTTLTNNIPPATVTNNESLAAIFPFEFEAPLTTPLFSGAALKKKLITTIYTDAKVNGHPIKLILDSGSAGSIITRQLMDQLGRRVNQAASVRIITADGATKTPISKIDNFPFEISGLITPIKILVIKATQYQALVGNDWLSKTNAILDWTTQELQLSQNGQHIRTPTTLDIDHNKLLPILAWDNDNNNEKEKQKEKPTWEVTINAWTNNNKSELMPTIN
ncbi:hypothetical protein G9A89_003727 [Geosiphon pyriformis]|nr:hypothetical protein G9A89_003727 [Geosiphon pyriformis]